MAGYRKLGRTSSQRKALLRNQVTNLLYHGRITTTVTKAKEIHAGLFEKKMEFRIFMILAKISKIFFLLFIPISYFSLLPYTTPPFFLPTCLSPF